MCRFILGFIRKGMKYIVLALIDFLSIFIAFWAIKGSIAKTKNKFLAGCFILVLSVVTLTLCIVISPFYILLPLLPHVPTVVIGQFMKIPTKGGYVLLADMGVNAVFLIVFGYIVFGINEVVLS